LYTKTSTQNSALVFLFLKGAFFIMPKTKTDKITGIEKQIEQLENERKKLIQEQKAKERKDRTNRLCKRGGLLESMLPDTVPLTDEQFKTFLEKTTANSHGRRILAEIIAQNAPAEPTQGAGAAAQLTLNPADKAPQTAQNGGTGGNAEQGNGARVPG
jgi:hypothetical protein